MVVSIEFVKTEHIGGAALLHGVHDNLRLAEGHGVVGSAMENPEREGVESADVASRLSAAEGHGSRERLGMGRHEVEGAVATLTHADDIDAVGVHLEAVLHPIQHIHQLVGIPRAAGVLRGDDQGVDVAPHRDGIQAAVLAHTVQVGTAEAVPVQEEYNGHLTLFHRIIVRCGNPEIIAVVHHVAIGRERIFRLCKNRQGQCNCPEKNKYLLHKTVFRHHADDWLFFWFFSVKKGLDHLGLVALGVDILAWRGS